MPEVVTKPPRSPAPSPAPVPKKAVPQPTGRIVSIDALRGFDLFWIVGGREVVVAALDLIPKPAPQWVDQAKHQLEHMKWQGFTAWDLIMPLFLFVVGAVMPFSFSRRAELGQSKGAMYWKILRRTLILFIVGMAVQGHLLDFNLSTLHPYSNTLQAIAVGYLIAGILLLNVPIWGQVVSAIVLIVSYWLLLMFVPVPGRGAGMIEEHANIALTVDQWVLGRLIDGTNPPYTWVLSSMGFAATVLLGAFAGHVLRSHIAPMMKFLWLTLLGIVCLAAGWAWAEYLHLPIVKHIWTSSMLLWAAGWSYLLLALFYLVIDVFRIRFWAFPLAVIGMNAIVAYVAYDGRFIPFTDIATRLNGGVARQLDIATNYVGDAAHPFGPAGTFTIAFTTVLLVWLLLYHLYRHKIFVRI